VPNAALFTMTGKRHQKLDSDGELFPKPRASNLAWK